MKITEEQKLKFALQYNSCINQLVKWLDQDRMNNMKLIEEYDFKCDHDFEGLAIKMFLQNLKLFHDHHYALEAAVQGAKDLIDPNISNI